MSLVDNLACSSQALDMWMKASASDDVSGEGRVTRCPVSSSNHHPRYSIISMTRDFDASLDAGSSCLTLIVVGSRAAYLSAMEVLQVSPTMTTSQLAVGYRCLLKLME